MIFFSIRTYDQDALYANFNGQKCVLFVFFRIPSWNLADRSRRAEHSGVSQRDKHQ